MIRDIKQRGYTYVPLRELAPFYFTEMPLPANAMLSNEVKPWVAGNGSPLDRYGLVGMQNVWRFRTLNALKTERWT